MSTSAVHGAGFGAGTCGELVQGFTGQSAPFHVTCPIDLGSRVRVSAQPSRAWEFTGPGSSLTKLCRAIEAAGAVLGTGPFTVDVEHSTDLDVGKGMGSSTADITAGARALADAVGEHLTGVQLAAIATGIESSDGSMHRGVVAMNHRTGQLVRSWDWSPDLDIVIVVPPSVVPTASVDFTGKEHLGSFFDEILARLDTAAASRDSSAFARAATLSARANQAWLPNPLLEPLEVLTQASGAAGVCVGHTGTVAGLLFNVGALPTSGLRLPSASDVVARVREAVPGGCTVRVVHVRCD